MPTMSNHSIEPTPSGPVPALSGPVGGSETSTSVPVLDEDPFGGFEDPSGGYPALSASGRHRLSASGRHRIPSTEALMRVLLPSLLGDLERKRLRTCLLRCFAAGLLVGGVAGLGWALGPWSLAWSLPLAALLFYLGAWLPLEPRCPDGRCGLGDELEG